MASSCELRPIPRNRQRTAVEFLGEAPDFLAALPVPQPNGTVARARDERSFVREEGQGGDRVLVAAEYAAAPVMADAPEVIPLERAQVLLPILRAQFIEDLYRSRVLSS